MPEGSPTLIPLGGGWYKDEDGEKVQLTDGEIEDGGFEVVTAEAPSGAPVKPENADPTGGDAPSNDQDQVGAASSESVSTNASTSDEENFDPTDPNYMEYDCARHPGRTMVPNLEGKERWNCGAPGRCAVVAGSGRPIEE